LGIRLSIPMVFLLNKLGIKLSIQTAKAANKSATRLYAINDVATS